MAIFREHVILHFLLFFIIMMSFSSCAHSEQCNLYDFNQKLLDSSWIREVNLDPSVPGNTLTNNWHVDNTDYKIAPFSLTTGHIYCAGYYNITTNVTGPGYVTFWWKKTRYPYGFTKMYFKIDQNSVNIYENPNFDWANVTADFGMGSHQLTWTFQIEKSLGGTFCWPTRVNAEGWIDEINICQKGPVLNLSQEPIVGTKLPIDVFNVSTNQELKSAINNNSSNKIINLICKNRGTCTIKGNYHIQNHKGNMKILAHPNTVTLEAEINDSWNIAIEDSNNISIEGITLKNGVNGILLEDVNNFTLKNTIVSSFKVKGISLNNTTDIMIIDNIIFSDDNDHNVTGIDINNSDVNIIVENNDISLNNPACTRNHKQCPDILLYDSAMSNLIFKGDGIIVDGSLHCAVKCSENPSSCICNRSNQLISCPINWKCK